MDRDGRWSLTPAFDITFSFNPAGLWTARHQMTINGKQDQFTRADLKAAAESAGLKRGASGAILEELCAVISRWPDYAVQAGVTDTWRAHVAENLRLNWPAARHAA
jgi:serine/threonine-protein kinase HipA